MVHTRQQMSWPKGRSYFFTFNSDLAQSNFSERDYFQTSIEDDWVMAREERRIQ